MAIRLWSAASWSAGILPARVWCGADFQICSVAGFLTRDAHDFGRLADLEIGDSAGLETCATRRWQVCRRSHPVPLRHAPRRQPIGNRHGWYVVHAVFEVAQGRDGAVVDSVSARRGRGRGDFRFLIYAAAPQSGDLRKSKITNRQFNQSLLTSAATKLRLPPLPLRARALPPTPSAPDGP